MRGLAGLREPSAPHAPSRAELPRRRDVVVIGAGMAGMATAMRLQASGLSTVVLEAHAHAGGCAGYYRRRGYSFDVGATTLVDFQPGGVGRQLLDEVGLAELDAQALPGYQAWLPDRVVTLHRDRQAWHAERLRTLGDTSAHRQFWMLLDQLSDVFWAASRAGVRMPVRRLADVVHNLRALGPRHLPLARQVNQTLGDALVRFGLGREAALVGLLGMLVEDTVHSTVERAPLINAALGVTIRGAGLTRHRGGMHGFWRALVGHYRAMGGELVCGCRVLRIGGRMAEFEVHTARGVVRAGQVVSSLTASETARVAVGTAMPAKLYRYLCRDASDLGGAAVLFLGVPDGEVADHELTHHQVLDSYDQPLGEGNNMFISVSAPGDIDSAPAGHRAVMISTHTDLPAWQGLSDAEYQVRKHELGQKLLRLARRVYPRLGENAQVCQVGTPRSYERYTSRPHGAVGGVRQTLANSNQHAIPHDLGVDGFWLVGDSTWPGLGTVACVLGSRIVAAGVLRTAKRITIHARPVRTHGGRA